MREIKFRGMAPKGHCTLKSYLVYGDLIHLDNGGVAIKPFGKEPVEVSEDSVVQLIGYAALKHDNSPITSNDEKIEVSEGDRCTYWDLDGKLKEVTGGISLMQYSQLLSNKFLTPIYNGQESLF